jgi:hypothetical protein
VARLVASDVAAALRDDQVAIVDHDAVGVVSS